MNIRLNKASYTRRAGFSLIEILTVVVLLSFIILGLMASFNQTQRAWRTSMTQTDVLEAGRMATDLVARDFVSVTPTFQIGVINFDSLTDPGLLTQPFPQAPSEVRTNIRQRVYFTTRQNKLLSGIGYCVLSPDSGRPDSPVGTLFRYETNVVRFEGSAQRDAFLLDNPTNANTRLSPIIDGVVHFAINAYDTNGALLNPSRLMQLGLYLPSGQRSPRNWNLIWRPGLTSQDMGWTFLSNAVPAYVDIELGILEQRTAEHAQAIPNVAARTQYLQSHLGNVHLFRQRIPIRNLDPEAYQ